MGFFGFFATMVGLGAMTKDAIQSSIETSISYDNARNNNDPYYFGSGAKLYSTKTGRRATKSISRRTHHEWLCDLKTGERIEDLTARRNNIKTEKNKLDAEKSGCAFYITHEFDTTQYKNYDIYKCTIRPGYFYKISGLVNEYYKGEVVDDILGKGKKVERHYGNHQLTEKYFEDGTPFSREGYEERSNQAYKQKAIQMGKRLYHVERVDENLKTHFVGYKDTITDEWYYWVKNYSDRYQKARFDENGKLVPIENEPICDEYLNVISN